MELTDEFFFGKSSELVARLRKDAAQIFFSPTPTSRSDHRRRALEVDGEGNEESLTVDEFFDAADCGTAGDDLTELDANGQACPSPAEIERRAAEIRAEWTPTRWRQAKQRAGILSTWEPDDHGRAGAIDGEAAERVTAAPPISSAPSAW